MILSVSCERRTSTGILACLSITGSCSICVAFMYTLLKRPSLSGTTTNRHTVSKDGLPAANDRTGKRTHPFPSVAQTTAVELCA